ncbi:hypothetical protein [Mycobacterium sp. M26]|uniref:bestrophin-like domain n=1 Tax=Mycobacterium sp. M26 TaxID=1762962 RepID=UPI00073E8947|nr:hypothetical protein [Mycobacterium sp. M26]
MAVTHYPLLVFGLAAVTLGASAWAGMSLLGRWHALDEDLRPDHSVVVAATLTLLALIIGFSFSMAVSRYDQRKNDEEAEANAIGTAFVRADLLPADDATKMRSLLAEYLDERILSYTTSDESQLPRIDAQTAQLQASLWSTVQVPANANPNPVIALAVSGINDVLNSQGYTQAANRNRIPIADWVFLGTIAICANVLVGWGVHRRKGAGRLLVVLPLISALSFLLIAEIDSPRHGFIKVQPQNLISLEQSIHPK